MTCYTDWEAQDSVWCCGRMCSVLSLFQNAAYARLKL
jgi:hypothetical protein